MVERAGREMTIFLANIERAIEQDDPVLLTKSSHSLKGMLLNLGLSDWADLAKKIEHNKKRDEHDSNQTIVDDIRKGIHQLL